MQHVYYLILAAGIAGLNIVILYLAWQRSRMAKLQADLCQLGLEVHKEVEALNALDDPAYRRYVRSIKLLVEYPRLISWSWALAALLKDIKLNHPAAINPQLRVILENSKQKSSLRIVAYLFYETLAGTVLRVCLPSIMRRKAERKAERPVEEYMDDLVEFRNARFSRAADCCPV